MAPTPMTHPRTVRGNPTQRMSSRWGFRSHVRRVPQRRLLSARHIYDFPPVLVAPNTTRLAQDVNVNPSRPDRLPTTGRPAGRPSHNQALQTDIANLPFGARDVRVNQQQVNAAGQRVGINRPDLQYTVNGQRYYIEYEGIGAPRGPSHRARITAKDPTAIVDVREIP